MIIGLVFPVNKVFIDKANIFCIFFDTVGFFGKFSSRIIGIAGRVSNFKNRDGTVKSLRTDS
jgi:hypothetical protein